MNKPFESVCISLLKQIKFFTVKHFEAEEYKRSPLYQIIKRSEDGISAERKVGSGIKAKKITKGNITKF